MQQIGQIKSKERVAKHGEVFTNECEVNAMLDLVKGSFKNIGDTFFEPACGYGAFLKEILMRKLKRVTDISGKGRKKYEKLSVLSVSSIYGIDIMEDNVEYCRTLLYGIWLGMYRERWKKNPSKECQDSVQYILSKNIICGDTLECNTVTGFDENDKPKYGNPIVIVEWQFDEKTYLVQRIDDFLKDMKTNNSHKEDKKKKYVQPSFEGFEEASSVKPSFKKYKKVRYDELYLEMEESEVKANVK